MDTVEGCNRGTQLNRIHPYPAMIADDFALRTAARYVQQGARVLDPFCGTARTLYAAAMVGGNCFGIDVNPLAILIAQAKGVSWLPSMPAPKFLLGSHCSATFDLQPLRKVRWFTKSAERELGLIVAWINSLSIDRNSRIALACILSATVREVSFCRKKQWKLHRMSAQDRRAFRPSALKVFKRRLDAVEKVLQQHVSLRNVTTVEGDARAMRAVFNAWGLPNSYDVIFTSPPYGDSRSTVGYGGISSMCLGVLRHVKNLELPFRTGQQIDSDCLGGAKGKHPIRREIKKYWKGSAVGAEWVRMSVFLDDLAVCCKEIAAVSHVGTKAIFVVSRRCVRRRRLYIDFFLRDELKHYGFVLLDSSRRRIEKKNTPYLINRKARSGNADRVRTMDHEFLLVFEKTNG